MLISCSSDTDNTKEVRQSEKVPVSQIYDSYEAVLGCEHLVLKIVSSEKQDSIISIAEAVKLLDRELAENIYYPSFCGFKSRNS